MRIAALAILFLGGCATVDDDSLVDNPVYEARSGDGWRLVIGDDIALRLGHNFVDYPIVYVIYRYPGVRGREHEGVRRWRSSIAGSTILIQAHPGPCALRDGSAYEHNVRVVTRRLELSGCGGRQVRQP